MTICSNLARRLGSGLHRGRVGGQVEVGGRSGDDEVVLFLLLLRLAVFAAQLRQPLVDVLGQFVDGDDAIGLVPLAVGLAFQPFEQHGGENAVVLQVERGGQAVGGEEGDAAGQRQVVLGVVVAEELAVGRFAQVRLGDRLAGVILEPLEVDVEEHAEALALELLERLLDLLGGDAVLVAAGEGGIGEEVAAAVARLAERSALADEGEQHPIVRAGLVAHPAQRLEEVGAGGLLALVAGLAEQQAHVLRVGAEVVLVGEQVVERLNIGLGVRTRLDLLVGVVADADQHHIGVRLPARGFGTLGSHGRAKRQSGHQAAQQAA
ncbi:MAG: hypothetical protein U0736_21440 [Gemmataceae bacterium]